MAEVTATWSVCLDTTCPSCLEYVDLLDYPDFWDGRKLEVGETCTANSQDAKVVCPQCGHEFTVDLEY